MNAEINTNVRLFDLVRFMRSELHQADLITDEEYFWLCAEAPMAKGSGSPSPRRLEDYDELRKRYGGMEQKLRDIIAHDGPGFPQGTCAKIAASGLDSQNANEHTTPRNEA